jgi:hypothetical protein
MNENYNYHEDEIEIDLLDLLFELLKHWRSLCLVILLGAVLGAGYQMMQKEESTQASLMEERAVLLENYTVDADTQSYMELAAEYYRLYDEEMDYMKHSIIMQMDASSVARGQLVCYIRGGADTRLITEKYISLIDEPKLLTEMKETAQLDCEEKYLREVLSATKGNQETVTGTSINSNTASVSTMIYPLWDSGEGDYVNQDNVVVTYTLSYSEQETCEQMMQVLKRYIDDLNAVCKEQYAEYDLEIVQSNVQMVLDNSYLLAQRTSMAAMNNYLTNIATLEAKIPSADLHYYELVYRTSDELPEEYVVVSSQSSVSLKALAKWGMIGIVVFVILWGMYFSLKYIFGGSIRNSDELSSVYGLPLLGKLCVEDSGLKGLDLWLANLQKRSRGAFEKEDFVEDMLCARSEQQMILCGDLKDAKVAEYLQTFATNCPKLTKAMFVHKDQETLVKAKDADGVILFVYTGRTARREVRRELEVCRIQEIPVLGSIIVM